MRDAVLWVRGLRDSGLIVEEKNRRRETADKSCLGDGSEVGVGEGAGDCLGSTRKKRENVNSRVEESLLEHG